MAEMLVFLIFFVKNGPTINHDITLHLHAQLKPKEQKNVAFFHARFGKPSRQQATLQTPPCTCVCCY